MVLQSNNTILLGVRIYVLVSEQDSYYKTYLLYYKYSQF